MPAGVGQAGTPVPLVRSAGALSKVAMTFFASSETPSKLKSKRNSFRMQLVACRKFTGASVILHYGHEKPFEEIGWMMDRSSEAVRKLWARLWGGLSLSWRNSDQLAGESRAVLDG